MNALKLKGGGGDPVLYGYKRMGARLLIFLILPGINDRCGLLFCLSKI